MQIIALFHYLWFILYKCLSNARNDLKGRRGENSVPGARRLN